MKYVSAAEFKAKCLKLMDEVQAGGEPITVTKRGRPVARLMAVAPVETGGSLIGCMRGSVLRYDDPFGPVVGEDELLDADEPEALYGPAPR